MRVRKWIIRAPLYLASLLLLLALLLLAAALILLRTDPGRRFLTRQVESLSAEGPIPVRIQGLSGPLPWRLEIERLELGDGQGVWLTGEHLALELSPAELLSLRLRLPLIQAKRIRVLRQPQLPESPAPTEPAPPFDLDELSLPPVTVDSLDITELALGPEFIGQELRLNIMGQARLGEKKSQAEFTLGNLDRPGDSIRLQAGLDGTPKSVAVDLEVIENPGGLVTSLSGLPAEQGLSLTLSGQGSPTDWPGSISLRTPGLADLDATFTVHAAKPLSEPFGLDLSLASSLDPGLIPTELRDPLGNDQTITASISFADKRLQIQTLQVQTPGSAGLSAQAHGSLDLSTETVNATVSARLDHPQVFAPDLDLAMDAPLDFALTAQGPITQPLLDLALRTDGAVTAQGASLAALDLNAHVEPLGPLEGLPGLDITLDGTLAQVLWPGLKTARSWNLSARARTNATLGLDSAEVELANPEAQLRLTAAGDPLSPDLTGELTLAIAQFSHFPEYFASVNGTTRIQTKWNLSPDLAYQAELDGHIDELSGLPPQAQALLGDAPHLHGRAHGDTQALALETLQVQGQGANLEATANAQFSQNQLQAQLLLDIPEIAPLTPQVNATGPIMLQVDLDGALDRPGLQATLHSPGLVVESQPVNDLNLDIRSDDPLSDARQAQVQLNALYRDIPVNLRTELVQEETRLSIPNFQLDAPGITAQADLNLDTESLLAQGDIRLASRDLSQLPDLGQPPLAGRLNATVKLEASEGGQDAQVELRAQDLDSFDGSATALSLTAQLRDLLRAPGGQVSLDLSGLNAQGLDVPALALTATGDAGQFQASASVQAAQPVALTLQTDVSAELNEQRQSLVVKQLSGELEGKPIYLNGEARLTLGDNLAELSPLELYLAEAKLNAQASRDQDAIRGSLDLDELNLADWASLWTKLDLPLASGTVQTHCDISGTVGAPRLALATQLAAVTLPGRPDLPSDLSVNATLDNGRISGSFVLKAPYGQQGHGWVTLPMALSLDPWNVSLDPGAPLDGLLQAPVNLEAIPLAAGLDDLRMEGAADIDLQLAGSLKSPDLHGLIVLQNALVEHFSSGAYMEGIDSHIRVDGRKLRLLELAGSDGQGGTLRAQGTAEIQDTGVAFDLNTDLDHASLVHRAELESQTSGSVSLSGDTERASLSGNLLINQAEVRIPERLPGAVVELPVKEINTPKAIQDEKKATPFPMDLDLRVNMPSRVFVRGRGLDSEWKGDIRVSGQADAPTLLGQLEVVRGRFDLLGKRFELTKGIIRLTGATPPDPVIDLTAEAQNDDLTVQALLTGPVSAPEIQLQSDPALPQDEILSRLLFGQDMASISGMQALQLAQAARQLAGGGGGSGQSFDVLARARELLMLDDLEISETPESGYTVGAGTYLSEDVYIELNKSLSNDKDQIRLEIELTPQLELESQVGTDGQGGLGLNWKYEY